MKRFGRLAVAVAAALSFAGCASTPTEVIRYQTTMPEMPSILVADCPITPPPDRDEYSIADWPTKEQLLSGAYTAQTNNLSGCNTDKAQLRSWWKQQQAIVESANAASAPASAAKASP
jgi:hypothetical protein